MAETAAPPRPAQALDRGPGYDDDFVLWSAHQAALLRAGRFDLVDLENVAEEIESLGRSDHRALASRLEVLIMHLLKWQFQPELRLGSWRSQIRTQRGRIQRLLKESPSLRRRVEPEVGGAYARARANAADETNLPLDVFPSTCPYDPRDLLDDDFWPGPEGAP
jgi:hypothetical protein